MRSVDRCGCRKIPSSPAIQVIPAMPRLFTKGEKPDDYQEGRDTCIKQGSGISHANVFLFRLKNLRGIRRLKDLSSCDASDREAVAQKLWASLFAGLERLNRELIGRGETLGSPYRTKSVRLAANRCMFLTAGTPKKLIPNYYGWYLGLLFDNMRLPTKS